MSQQLKYPVRREGLCAFTPPTRAIFEWLISEDVQRVVNSRDCNWKLVINGKWGGGIRTVIERHEQLLDK